VITEDQVVSLFAKANPVPSLDLLDPVDLEHLEDRSERSSEMTELKIDKGKEEVAGRRPRLVPVLALAAIAVVALAILLTRDSGVASPVDVANRYMEARENLDAEAAHELFAPDGAMNEQGWKLNEMPALFAWYRASNWTWTPGECSEVTTSGLGTMVNCTYESETDWTRAFDDAPITGDIAVLVSEGEIADLVAYIDTSQFNDAWQRLAAWVERNHPDDYRRMYTSNEVFWHPSPSPLIDRESIALWEEYIPGFVAEIEG
jgi:hypothetical protein